jgi:hypothetical protein
MDLNDHIKYLGLFFRFSLQLLKSYIYLHPEPQREISSAGSEHLPYKQGVTGSNPVSPTKKASPEMMGLFF